MSFTFDINKDPHFQMAREAGIKEGIEIGIQKGHNSGLHEGIEKGITKGIAKGKSETAMRMLEKGFEIEVIAEVTGLSIKDVHVLKKDMH